MTKEIQKLIKELEAAKSRAKRDSLLKWEKRDNDALRHLGKRQAFDLCIQKLTLLLKNKHESKHPESPITQTQ